MAANNINLIWLKIPINAINVSRIYTEKINIYY